MNEQSKVRSIRRIELVGAGAWVVVAIAWQIAEVLERSRPWEGLPRAFFLLGYPALFVGGVALVGSVIGRDGDRPRSAATWVGIGFLGLGVVFVAIAAWAIPLWAAALGIGMLVLAATGAFDRRGWIIGGALVAAPLIMLLLTELQVGTADEFGDYEIAWASATWIATIGAAAGLAMPFSPAHGRERVAD